MLLLRRSLELAGTVRAWWIVGGVATVLAWGSAASFTPASSLRIETCG
jgi:hypothetical protein